MLNYHDYEKELKQLGITDEEEQQAIMQALYNYAIVACDIYLKRNINMKDEEKDSSLQ